MTQVTQIDIDFAEQFRRGNGGKYDRDVSTLAHQAASFRIAAEARGMAEIERLREALQRIEQYEYPKIARYHEEKFYGEATGNEYTYKTPIPKEQGFQAINSIKGIARAALNGGQHGTD